MNSKKIKIEFGKILNRESVMVVLNTGDVVVFKTKDVFNSKELRDESFFYKNFQYDERSVWWNNKVDINIEKILKDGIAYDAWRNEEMNNLKEVTNYFGTKIFLNIKKSTNTIGLFFIDSNGGKDTADVEVDFGTDNIEYFNSNIRDLEEEAFNDWYKENKQKVIDLVEGDPKDTKPVYIGWSEWDLI